MGQAVQLVPARTPVHYERRRPEETTLYRLDQLAHGFLRLRCGDCGHEKLVAFSCKRRGFCPSCGARRMAQSAAHLVDNVIPQVPVRQWVLSFPIPLRILFAAHPQLLTPVLQVIHRVITGFPLSSAANMRSFHTQACAHDPSRP